MGLSRTRPCGWAPSRVTCIYRRDEASMPGSRFMVRWAKEEGVQFRFLAVPVRFIGNESGDLCAVECAPVRPTSPNLARCHRPVPEPGETFTVKADFAALAFGFNPSRISGTDDGLALTEKGSYAVDATSMTSRRGVFAGGARVVGWGRSSRPSRGATTRRTRLTGSWLTHAERETALIRPGVRPPCATIAPAPRPDPRVGVSHERRQHHGGHEEQRHAQEDGDRSSDGGGLRRGRARRAARRSTRPARGAPRRWPRGARRSTRV